jgi:hypothetical protein
MDSALNKAPDTNYDFYKNVGSDQRAALYKQLLDQQRSPGNLIAQGIGGIGDAFSALGGKSTDFQDKAAGIASKNTENRIGAVDTQRQQKMQDLTGNEEAAMLDPKGPRSVAMREMLKSQNINVPSGMNAKTMLSTLGPIAEIAMAKAKLAEEAGYHSAEIGQKEAGRNLQEQEFVAQHPILNFLNPVGGGAPSTPVSNPNAPHGIPELGSHFNGGKVLSVKRMK